MENKEQKEIGYVAIPAVLTEDLMKLLQIPKELPEFDQFVIMVKKIYSIIVLTIGNKGGLDLDDLAETIFSLEEQVNSLSGRVEAYKDQLEIEESKEK